MDVRLKEPHRYRAVPVDAHADRERFLQDLLLDRGIVVVGRYGSLGEVATLQAPPECDLIIVYRQSGSQRTDDLPARVATSSRRPVLLICETDDAAGIASAIAAGANAVMCVGPSSDRLRSAAVAAISVFEQTEGHRRHAEKAERSLADRKLVERAKGILMQQCGIQEPEAHRELQRVSMARNQTLPQVAQTVIAAKELLG